MESSEEGSKLVAFNLFFHQEMFDLPAAAGTFLVVD